MNDQSKKVLLSLQALSARKEYCSSDIRKKALERMDGDTQAVDEILASLIEDKFVDDGRYAAAFARDKATLTGWGPIKILHALRAKKIDPKLINAAIEEISEDTARAAYIKLKKVLETKAHSLQGDPYIKFKLIRFALSRGYEYDSITPIVDDILNE